MQSQLWLAVVVVSVLMVAFVFDFAALARGDPRSTVSAILGQWSRDFPVLPFFVGMLMGHFFWPGQP